ncbi:nitronate monooxygenase [Roseovarius sp. TE539]|uniref:NAD(P)H-dependent flavin oxidoreductase n=1 Tax=Roseovarius sp. TE539 TaxID=2249812 RepID=UPI000DDF9F23|nr:nitronate monooxygenase [Roseovarius sp. TE539]RBI72719.1 nitronate monooxygenase [Roseovarius sp. TE539]
MWPDKTDGPALRAHLRARLALPLFVAPMFLISGPELVIASARAGSLVSFPSINARTPAELDRWLRRIAEETEGNANWGVNLILHKSNGRLEDDLAATVRAKAPLVVASVGAPSRVIGPVHDYGGLVFSDVASLRHARKAVAEGVDGLVLLTAGAGGNTGWLNPFAFVEDVRKFFDGPIAVAGAIGSGRALHALEVLDADLGYAGTPFIATRESMAQQDHKQTVVETDADGLSLSSLVTGIPANFARSSLLKEGIIDNNGNPLHEGVLDVASWKTVWSMGHGCGAINTICTAGERIDTMAHEWRAARQISVSRSAQ